MSNTERHNIDDATLERYLDGELDAARAGKIEAAVADDAALREQLEEMRGARDLLRQHLFGAADAVDFSGLSERVLARCDETPPLPWSDRLVAWLREVFAYRKPIWVPSMALAAAAAVTLMLPGIIDNRGDGLGHDPIANAGVEVQSLETGTAVAMVYQMPTTNTTVIWIADHSGEE